MMQFLLTIKIELMELKQNLKYNIQQIFNLFLFNLVLQVIMMEMRCHCY